MALMLHGRDRRDRAQRVAVGDVPPERQHDADAQGHEPDAMSRRGVARAALCAGCSRVALFAALGIVAGPAARVEARPDRAGRGADPCRARRRARAALAAVAPDDAYRRVARRRGVFLHDRETLVQASTCAGAGWWVMTPLRTDDGGTVLINRGLRAADRATPQPRRRRPGPVTVTGLLRLDRARRRLPAQQRSRRGSLVFARRRRDRARARRSRRPRPISSMPTPAPNARRLAGRRADRGRASATTIWSMR